jgi:GntR family transcriptional regulator, rspAB operon transcriptional repressor
MLQMNVTKPQGPASLVPLSPLDRFTGSLSQRVYGSLRQAIMTLAYRPGQLLPKAAICAALGVSRSPVSEALARLATEGLVDVVPQAGSYVARFSMQEIREGAFLREALEVAAVNLVAPRITDDQIAALRHNLQRQRICHDSGDFAGFHAEDSQFHEAILTFTGHRRLPQLSRTTWVHVDRARRVLLPRPGRIAETITEHQAIIAGLAAHDPARARTAIERHLRQLLVMLEPVLAEHPELFA